MRAAASASRALLVAVLLAAPAAGEERRELLRDGGFEAGARGWVLAGDFQADDRFGHPRSGRAYAYLATPAGDAAASLSGTLEQSVAIPAETTRAILSFWWSFSSYGRGRLDAMHVTIRDMAGDPLETVALVNNRDPLRLGEYRYVVRDLSRYRGRSIRLRFEASTDATGRTVFRVDDVSLVGYLEMPAVTASAEPAWSSPEQAGLAAEMAGDWPAALAVYEPLLAAEPDRGDLWIRVADIEAAAGRPADAALALGKAAELSPGDADLRFRQSQALAAADQPREALAAISQALALDPGNLDYLRSRAQLASWNGDTRLARDSYEAILAAVGPDREAELGRARAEAWLGDVDRAVGHYEEYLARYPEDEAAHLEYARTQGWRGNFAAGLEAIERYEESFGETDESAATKARLLVGARRPNAALSLVSPLLEAAPEDPGIRGTHALALADSGRPRQALEEVERLAELYPDEPQTRSVRKVVDTPLRSLIRPVLHSYSDSDSVDRTRFGLEGALRLAPGSHLTTSLFTGESRADTASGLAAPDGRESVALDGAWLRLDQRLGPRATVTLEAGITEVENRDAESTYRIGLRLRPADALSLELSRERDLHAVSPRSLALGVRRDTSRGALRWSPAPRYWLDVVAARDDLSDANRKDEAIVAVRRAMARKAGFNFDLGVRGWWFSFDTDPGSGYYAPADFRRYSALGFFYWKLSEDRGLAFSISPGFLRDDTMPSYEFSADATFELTIGIYHAWMLVVRASVTENGRAETGAFSATSGAILLTRRF